MKKDIYTNIKESDALESFFECITTSCSINSEGVDCATACYMKHLEPKNINSEYILDSIETIHPIIEIHNLIFS